MSWNVETSITQLDQDVAVALLQDGWEDHVQQGKLIFVDDELFVVTHIILVASGGVLVLVRESALERCDEVGPDFAPSEPGHCKWVSELLTNKIRPSHDRR